MAKEVSSINVEGMSCQHCVNNVSKAIGALKGVADVNIDLKDKKVTVGYDPAQVTIQAIKETIEDQGYDVN